MARRMEELDIPDVQVHCAICGEILVLKCDSNNDSILWGSCLSCSNFATETWEELQLEKERSAVFQEKWLKAEQLYRDLQDHIKAMIF